MACVAAGVSMVLSAWATRFALEPRVFFSFIGFSSSEAHATEHTTRNTRIPVEAGALRADPRARRRAPIPAHPEPHDVHDLPCECSVVLPWNQFLPWDQFFACFFLVPRQKSGPKANAVLPLAAASAPATSTCCCIQGHRASSRGWGFRWGKLSALSLSLQVRSCSGERLNVLL